MITVVSVSAVWKRRDVFTRSLTLAEREVFDQLGIDKRKKDWLAGRVAAKRAVQKLLGLPFSAIEIGVEASGRPTVSGAHLSITHSGDVAAAIASLTPIGLDVETVEARDSSFEDLVLTDTDKSRLASASDRNTELTTIWCEKEAYAKWEGEGLRIPFSELCVPSDRSIARGALDIGGTRYVWVTVD